MLNFYDLEKIPTFQKKNHCQGICAVLKKFFIVKALNLMKYKDKIFFHNNYAESKQISSAKYYTDWVLSTVLTTRYLGSIFLLEMSI